MFYFCSDNLINNFPLPRSTTNNSQGATETNRKKMKTLIRILCSFTLLVLAFACTGDMDDFLLDENGNPVINEHVKSVSTKGLTTRKFHYDSFGKLIEDSSSFFYNKYSYDENGRLMKVETASDGFSQLCSSYVDLNNPRKIELMTSANSTITWIRSFKYDNQGRLSKIESYIKKDGENFEFTSFLSFEYEGGNICKENLCDETGNIMQFYEYAYDQKGNRTNERYNVCIFEGTPSSPKLYYEKTYKYDDYNNPYQILNVVGPSFYTSANNMTEMTTVSYTDDPRTEIAKQSFIYNDKGYPVKMKYDGGEEEYTY